MQIDYDNVTDPTILQLNTTRNTGFAVALKFSADVKTQKSPGVVVGNSHLFWHPDGSYERARQLGILAIELEQFASKFSDWPVFLGGDFNSSPDDVPYIFLIKRPSEISEIPSHTFDVLKRSVEHLCSKQSDPDAARKISIDDRGKSLISLYQKISRHNVLSVYGENYRLVHSENAIESDYFEPAFSNWAHSWRGLLDYLFLFEPKHQDGQRIKVLQLLRMPEPAEMGPEPSGQPRESQFPSDHLAIMATLSIS